MVCEITPFYDATAGSLKFFNNSCERGQPFRQNLAFFENYRANDRDVVDHYGYYNGTEAVG